MTFLFSGVDGLRQLAVFTIAGLGVAALTTRFLLPARIDPAPRDPASSPRLAALWKAVARLPRPRAWRTLARTSGREGVPGWVTGSVYRPVGEAPACLRASMAAARARWVFPMPDSPPR